VIAVRDHLDHFADAALAVVTFADPGRLRYLSLPSSPDARPPVSDLIAALD
jgi:hypothetical protein